MTRVAHIRAELAPYVRLPMTEARKRRIWHMRKGLCGECGEPVPMLGPEVIYDHRIPIETIREDKDANVWPLHTVPCNARKLAKDLADIAKTKRIALKHTGQFPAPLRRLQGRGFQPRYVESEG
ncbi:MAG: HNH endonuclease [Patescibacteria group bacterium]|nr:HNH endonuclease [Patescibacteria group bacterium]